MRGDGPPLVLIHGFPQCHAMWHRIAPALAERFQVITMDLRGYGWSSAPRAAPDHSTYSKRAMGEDVLAVIEHFGHVRADVAGHDGGGRVAYRWRSTTPAASAGSPFSISCRPGRCGA